jgi:creatinine amidohydrolase/Fe(II)-dependent formamide hydrolase-like protein
MTVGTRSNGIGSLGNPARSTAAYGEQILEMQIAAAVSQIRRLRETSRR